METDIDKQIASLKKWFNRYVESFYKGDPENDQAIRLKQLHTHRVCLETKTLTGQLDLDATQCSIAEIVALLHDLGRFEQFARYGTFVDLLSVNHALLGVKVAACKRLLDFLSKPRRTVVFKAIAYHNALKLPDGQNTTTRLQMRLIRDADKLDIWRVFMEYYGQKKKNSAVALGLPDKPDCSPKVLKAIQTGSYAKMADLRTLNDFKLLQISWVFDLNFPETHKAVLERGYIEKIAETLPELPEITAAVKFALDFVRQQAKRGQNVIT